MKAQSYDPPAGVWADRSPHREGFGHVIAESVAGVGSIAVGLVDVGGRTVVCIESPRDLFEIFDEFATFGIDEETRVARGVAQPSIDAIDAIAHGWIGLGQVEGGVVQRGKLAEEIFNNRPIRVYRGGAALVAAGVAIDLNLHAVWIEGAGALVEGLARQFGIGVGQNDFVKNVDHVTDALDEEHAHGIDVEIERPDEGM